MTKRGNDMILLQNQASGSSHSAYPMQDPLYNGTVIQTSLSSLLSSKLSTSRGTTYNNDIGSSRDSTAQIRHYCSFTAPRRTFVQHRTFWNPTVLEQVDDFLIEEVKLSLAWIVLCPSSLKEVDPLLDVEMSLAMSLQPNTTALWIQHLCSHPINLSGA